MAVLFRLTQDVRQLPFQPIQPVIERSKGRLSRGGFVGEARRVRRLPLGKDLALDLAELFLEALDALLWRRLLALREGRHGGRRIG